MITREQVIEMLETIIDPEIGIDVWTMGLIYRFEIIGDTKISVVMTYTTPMCPYGEQLKEEVEDSLRMVGFTHIDMEVTFDPPWKPSQELREALGV